MTQLAERSTYVLTLWEAEKIYPGENSTDQKSGGARNEPRADR